MKSFRFLLLIGFLLSFGPLFAVTIDTINVGGALNIPYDVALDSHNNLFIADTGDKIVRKVTPEGVSTIVAGIPKLSGYNGDNILATKAVLQNPSAVAVDASDNLFIADDTNNRIRKIGSDGLITTVAGGCEPCAYTSDQEGPATSVSVSGFTGLLFDPQGNLIFGANGRLRKLDSQGYLSIIAGGGSLLPAEGARALEVDLQPRDIAVDGSGNIYVSTGDKIFRITVDGLLQHVAGVDLHGYYGDGGLAAEAAFASPSGIGFDSLGNLYIVDESNNAVRWVDTSGIVRTIEGATNLGLMKGLAVDLDGNVYVANRGNAVVQKISNPSSITPSLTITSVAGFPVAEGAAVEMTLPSSTDPNGVTLDIAATGIADGTTVYVLRDGSEAGQGVLSEGKVSVTIALPSNPQFGPLASSQIQATSMVPLDTIARNALPQVKGVELVKAEVSAPLSGKSVIRYISQDGKRYTLAALQARSRG